MKRELALHLGSLLVLFLLITLIRGFYTSPLYLLFWFGGLVGTILPDIDHLIYCLYLRPHELTSQRVKSTLEKKDFKNALLILWSTREERKNLIFHNTLFQIVFLAATFWVFVSSISLFVQGFVLAFSLHLWIDQYFDLTKSNSLATWFSGISLPLNEKTSWYYWGGVGICILVLSVLI